MLVTPQKVKVKWSNRISSHYINLGYPKLKHGEEFEVEITHLTRGSHALVKCECDFCGEVFENKYCTIQNSKNNFCSRDCQDNFLVGKPSWNSRKIIVNCGHCEKEIERSEWELKRSKNLFCSKECSDDYKIGKGKPRAKRIKLNCSNCDTEIERTENGVEKFENHFCSKACSDEFSKGRINVKNRKGQNVNCYNCCKEFYLADYRIKSQERYFCGNECRKIWLKSEEFSQLISQVERDKVERIKVICHTCSIEFDKLPSDMRSEKHFCSDVCRNVFFISINPNPKKDKIKVNCEQCQKNLEVHESIANSNKWHFCSRECYATYRSEKLIGDKVYNYQNIIVNCDNCGDETKVTQYQLENRKNVFCCQGCYYEFRSKYYIRENHPQFGVEKTPEQIERMRIITANRIANGDFPQTNTSIQTKTRELVRHLKYSFEEEIQFKYYVLDFYHKESNLAIEVMGDYWHVNPLRFTEYNSLHDIQKKDVKRDKSKKTYLKKYYNINVLYLWEYDINNRIDVCEELIKCYYNSNGILADYNSFNYEIIKGELKLKEQIIQPYFMRANTKYQTI